MSDNIKINRLKGEIYIALNNSGLCSGTQRLVLSEVLSNVSAINNDEVKRELEQMKQETLKQESMKEGESKDEV